MSLVRVGFVPIPPGAKPGFDHADTYRAGRRMYVAHTGADRVEVLDCDARTFLRSLPELPGVAGVLIDEEHDLLFTSDREAARVSIFRCSTEQLLGQVEVGPHPNGLAFDWRRRRVYAFNLGQPLGEHCSASVVDLDSMQVLRELPLPGRPRWALYDEERDRIYANIRQPAEILLIDAERATIDKSLLGAERRAARALARLGAASSAPPTAARWSCSTATPVTSSRACRYRECLTSSCTTPTFTASTSRSASPASSAPSIATGSSTLETVETEPGAHTLGWDPTARCLYVFCPESGGATLFEEQS